MRDAGMPIANLHELLDALDYATDLITIAERAEGAGDRDAYNAEVDRLFTYTATLDAALARSLVAVLALLLAGAGDDDAAMPL